MVIPATLCSSSCHSFLRFRVDSNQSRGFGNPNNNKTNKGSGTRERKGISLQQRTKNTGPSPTQAPGLSSRFDGKSKTIDIEFEERLQAVRRSAVEQKKADEVKQFGPIDYDAPVENDDKKTIGLGTKIGVGVAVVVFGLVFALGDFLPSVSENPNEAVDKQLSEEEKATLQTQLKQYEATLGVSPKDPDALEGAAVTLAELGDYSRAASLLQDLAKAKPTDPNVFRLLGEVKYELKDYQGSAVAYRITSMVSKNVDFEVLRGYTNALLAAKKPDEAVQVLLAARDRLNSEKPASVDTKVDGNTDNSLDADLIQVNFLLGKAYSEWGRVSDAVSVYDQLISTYPNDFRGYLAKGIILKENGSLGDAERMFIQARFFAPEKAKALVDRYARR